MRRTYQTEWQDIQFDEFVKPSSRKLAGPEFYQAFYEKFFSRYQHWDQLSAAWRAEKERCAAFVLARAGEGARILSVGCGLGAMEHYLHASRPQPELFIHEVAPSAWRWIGTELPDERKFVGWIPDCLPAGSRFDTVYLSAVDYALDDDALVGLLASIRPFLSDAPQAQCLIISASFNDRPAGFSNRLAAFAREIKGGVKAVLDLCGLRPRGQFWGWSRSKEEYRSLMQRAGYRNIEDGFIDPQARVHYWIAAR